MRELGCSLDKDQCGLFLWGRIPAKWADGFKLSDQTLQEAKVFITPGGIFGEQGKNYLRISLCSTDQLLQQALTRIKEIKLR